MCLKKWITSIFATLVMQCALTVTANAHELTTPRSTGRGGDFTLQSFAGPVSLQALRGKVVLLFFGYTSCADVCPTTLWALSKVFSKLSTQEMEQVVALFISLDPKRDTPDVLHGYTELFHKNIIGVTGSEEALAEVAESYGVVFERKVDSDSTLGYTIYHTSDVLVIDSRGELMEEKIELSTDANKITASIRALLN